MKGNNMATAMDYEDVITWVSSNQSVEKLNDIAQLAFDRSKVLARRSKDQWQPNMPVHFVQSDGEVMNGHVRAVNRTKVRVSVGHLQWTVPMYMLRHGHKV
tara:strand:+ start:3045 stop:3347 length:303 start_codon:yes stop_codon:yes gene_type:complete